MKHKILAILSILSVIAIAGSVTILYFASEGEHDWDMMDGDVFIRERDFDNSSFYWYANISGTRVNVVKGSESVVPNGINYFLNFTAPELGFEDNYTVWVNTSYSENYDQIDGCTLKIQNKSGNLVELPDDGTHVILCYNCNISQSYYAGYKFYQEPGELDNCTVFIEAFP